MAKCESDTCNKVSILTVIYKNGNKDRVCCMGAPLEYPFILIQFFVCKRDIKKYK